MDPLIKSQLLYQLSYTPVPAPAPLRGPAARARNIRKKAALARRLRRGMSTGPGSGGGAVDFDHLETYCAGDMQVVTDVLVVFREQAQAWAERLADPGEGGPSEGWRDLAHTIKGAARGIGALALGEAADRAEHGAPSDLAAVRAELDAAVAEVEGYLTRIGGG